LELNSANHAPAAALIAQDLFCAANTLSTAIADPKAVFEVAHRSCAQLGGVPDFSFSYSVTEANVHSERMHPWNVVKLWRRIDS
jgi:hypothetical protein